MNKELKYGGFFRRFIANVIDGLLTSLMVPMIISYNQTSSKMIDFVLLLLLFLFSQSYFIFCHAIWGRTLGKFLTKIKVLRLDGFEVDFKTAFLRNSVDVFLGFLYLFINGINLSTGFLDHWFSMTLIVAILWMLWFWSEPFVLLFNKKKRSFQDFVGGTVVVLLS